MKYFAATCFAIAACVAVSGFASATERAASVVVLRNGQVFHGVVEQSGEFLLVTLANGEIRVRPGDVELVAGSLAEALARKRESVPRGDVTSHLNLADWCVQQGLLTEGAELLEMAKGLDPQHPRLPLIALRLDLARQPAKPEGGPPAAPSAHTANHDDLDRFVRSLPPGSVELFGQIVQPMLLNSCTTTGCHGPNSTTGFALQRQPLSRTQVPRTTQRNLMAAVAQIKLDQPHESPLLLAASQPHAGAKLPLFTGRDTYRLYQLAWFIQRISSAAPRVPSTAPASPGPSVEPPTAAVAVAAPIPVATPVEPASSPLFTQGTPTVEPRRVEAFLPRDPFDPEIFNRQFSPQPAGESPPTTAAPPPLPQAPGS